MNGISTLFCNEVYDIQGNANRWEMSRDKEDKTIIKVPKDGPYIVSNPKTLRNSVKKAQYENDWFYSKYLLQLVIFAKIA